MQTVEVIDYIVQWLADYAQDSGLNGFVVGVSGGVDSAVTSVLCARTGKKVIALDMPIHQDQGQKALAAQHIQWLEQKYANVEGVETDLTASFTAIQRDLPLEIQDDLAMANTRSRLRMLALYAFASHYRLLVAGTGNRVEDFGVGFYTKYGDGGVDLSPIADLMKSQVYTLAREMKIIEGIVAADPTDGLFDDSRTDEGQLGASYAELEAAMAFEADSPGPEDEAELDARQRKVLGIYRRLNRANRHKMVPVPVCTIPEHLK
ncbi:MAG TPA: NAD(+) synthase [Desulfobacteraceae bacterium]|nr:NAD(+) synthase [Desulfobacteraceae bacterium]